MNIYTFWITTCYMAAYLHACLEFQGDSDEKDIVDANTLSQGHGRKHRAPEELDESRHREQMLRICHG